MDSRLDNLNYARDPRTQGPAKTPELHFFGCGNCGCIEEECACGDFKECDISEPLPTHWEVCPVCSGKGTHVNPSIDAGGISAEQFHDDPDFAEDYMAGNYDQQCNRCSGRTTVQAVDWDALTATQRKLYEEQLQADSDWDAERLAEIRAGC